MSEVANLELCKELYELSGWFPKPLLYAYYNLSGTEQLLGAIRVSDNEPEFSKLVLLAPAYDLGYLLRKLPGDNLHLQRFAGGEWLTTATFVKGKKVSAISSERADTPEDTACKLAIELFKQGVLKREASNG